MDRNTTIEKIASAAKAIHDAGIDAENITLTLTVGSESELNRIDKELYTISNGTDEGFTPAEEISISIMGVDISVKARNSS